MSNYVIHKRSRTPALVSYNGPTWDNAGIRNKRKDVYKTRMLAEDHAKILSTYNPVGFEVSEIK